MATPCTIHDWNDALITVVRQKPVYNVFFHPCGDVLPAHAHAVRNPVDRKPHVWKIPEKSSVKGWTPESIVLSYLTQPPDFYLCYSTVAIPTSLAVSSIAVLSGSHPPKVCLCHITIAYLVQRNMSG